MFPCVLICFIDWEEKHGGALALYPCSRNPEWQALSNDSKETAAAKALVCLSSPLWVLVTAEHPQLPGWCDFPLHT